MGGLVRILFGLFLSTGGVAALAALEATVFFWFPFGIDAAVVILVVRNPGVAWLYPILATGGSVAGAALTFWMGRKLGEAGLDRHIPARRLESVKARIRDRSAFAIAALSIIPPPFPFTAFLLACGALDVGGTPFFVALTLARLLRFGTEAVLAARYGTGMLAWLESDLVQAAVVCLILLAILASVVSVYVLLRRAPFRRLLKSTA